jgi:Tol biopolymer transport system component
MSLSADGRRIAYTERIDSSNIERIRFDPEKEIVVGVPEPVTRGTLQVSYMDLSPDGGWLAFNSLGEQEDIYVIRSDGSARRQLTDDPVTDRGPRWSPDGKQIAFFSGRGGKVESRSQRSHTLLSLLPDTIFLPVPSPDDRWIYFVRRSAEADVWLLTLE